MGGYQDRGRLGTECSCPKSGDRVISSVRSWAMALGPLIGKLLGMKVFDWSIVTMAN